MVKLSIVILNYNTKALTLQCLEKITEQYKSFLEKGELEVFVVDNASTDGSTSAINKLQLKINNLKLVKNKKNLGFAKGCNVGAKASQGEYILFLNSDTEIKDKGFLGMREFLEKNKDVGVLGGRLLNPDGSFQPSAGKFYTLFNLFLMLIGGERVGLLRESPDKLKKVDWVSGACMMIKRETFDKLKGFDEYFFMYMEDMELCFRARKMGFLTYFYPDISLMHKELGSGNRAFAIASIYDGILYFYKKHKTKLEYVVAKFLLSAKAVVAITIGTLTGNNYLKTAYKQALNF